MVARGGRRGHADSVRWTATRPRTSSSSAADTSACGRRGSSSSSSPSSTCSCSRRRSADTARAAATEASARRSGRDAANPSRAGGRRVGARRLPRVGGRGTRNRRLVRRERSRRLVPRGADAARRDDRVAGGPVGPHRRRGDRSSVHPTRSVAVGRRGASPLRLADLPRRCALPPECDRPACAARARAAGEAARARCAHPRAHRRDAPPPRRRRRDASGTRPRERVPSSPSTRPRPGFPGYRLALAVASSHIVLTEPVPDVLDELGWTGGEAIVDSRTLVHYTRTTRDGRIVFGWGGGAMGLGGRSADRLELDPRVVESTARGTRALLPADPRTRGHACLGRPDRRLPEARADLREPRARPSRVRLHGKRSRPVVPRRRDPRPTRARPARRAHRARDRRARAEALPAGAVSLRRAARSSAAH